jgi:photosystem II stability/assembly factor-like uncharacterized protein
VKRFWTLIAIAWAGFGQNGPLPKDDGYRGIWYYNEPSHDEYVYKYSGGFATYPQQQSPIAYYARKVNKTFFCYGGTVKGKQELLHMVSYYDHATGKVARPRILLNKRTDDAHDNPVMTVDEAGHIWIFSNSHGTSRPSYIYKSKQPYSIEEFERVLETNFSYGHAWYLAGRGFLFPHTRYLEKGRSLFWMTSPDGMSWSQPQLLARVALGHYQITACDGRRLATVFNYHPDPQGVNWRTNLYYLETSDMGKTWKTVEGKPVAVPVKEVKNPALVHDYGSEGLLVYLKTVQFEAQGNAVILYLTSKGYASGPANDPRTWYTARWTGKDWQIRRFTTSDHNYDFGSLCIESNGVWRVIAPTEPGPQPYGTGGEMVMWTSADRGQTWKKVKELTHNSPRNHTYARKPVNAHADFYALWADGDTRKPSESNLYFTDKAGTHVWRLPPVMKAEFERPEIAW